MYSASSSYTKTIKSPNYPRNYDDDTDCTWTVKTFYFNYIVKVVINDFELEKDSSDPRCQYDSLKFYDGSSSANPLLGLYCGTARPDVIYSTGRYLHVKFHTDSLTVKRGFNFSYLAVKSGTGTV